jgi:hypothetical protein
MITQSFDEAVVSRLRALILDPAAAQLSASNLHELSLSLYESPAFLDFQEQVLDDLRKDLLERVGEWAKSTPTVRAR